MQVIETVEAKVQSQQFEKLKNNANCVTMDLRIAGNSCESHKSGTRMENSRR